MKLEVEDISIGSQAYKILKEDEQGGGKAGDTVMNANNECLASEFDNLFYNRVKVRFVRSGVIIFYTSFVSLKNGRVVSDHIPIWFQFSLN